MFLGIFYNDKHISLYILLLTVGLPHNQPAFMSSASIMVTEKKRKQDNKLLISFSGDTALQKIIQK